MKQVLILGGGSAGIAAALNLAQRGVFSTIIEESPSIGGQASELCCKGDTECVRCDVCLTNDKLYEVVQSEYIRVLTDIRIKSLSGTPGSYRVGLETAPRYVDERACVACGLCTEVCPVEGSAIKPFQGQSVPLAYRLDESKCINLTGEECDECSLVCPTDAIDFDPQAGKRSFDVGAVIVAIGFQPFDALQDPRLGYGEVEDVITSLEAERDIRENGRLTVPSTGDVPERVAIIQCVGSRDEKRGVEYCSKVCCKYSHKIAQYLIEMDPDTEVDFFFMDWRPYDPVDENIYTWSEDEERVGIIRSRPAEVSPSRSGRPSLRFAASDEAIGEEEYDLVILSIGILPPADAEAVADLLGLETTSFGFMSSLPDSPTSTGVAGLFVAGCASGPKDIEESTKEGEVAAERAVSFMEGTR